MHDNAPNQSPEPTPKAFGVPDGHRGSRRESAVAPIFALVELRRGGQLFSLGGYRIRREYA